MRRVTTNRRSFLQTTTATIATSPLYTSLGQATSGFIQSADSQIVGAHYYPWWGKSGHWLEGYYGHPQSAEYSSRNDEIIQQHVNWLTNAGIQWLSLSWWGPDSWEDRTIRNHLLPHDAFNDLKFSILYEPLGVLEEAETGGFDFDDPETRQRFIDHVRYLNDNYFTHDQHLRFDDRPVLYIYIINAFRGDFPGTLETLRSEYGINPYIIGDIFHWFSPGPRDIDIARAVDAFSAYSLYNSGDADQNQEFIPRVRDLLTDWALTADFDDVDFIPPAMPGKHDGTDSSEVVLERSPKRFERFLTTALELADATQNAILINSFNEWHEGTQIEPGESYGTSYLDRVRPAIEAVSGRLPISLQNYAYLELTYPRTVEEHKLNSDIPESRSRYLAFWCSKITFVKRDESVAATYDIGTPSKEPLFLQGAYGANENPPTSRWFGGAEARTVIAVERSILEDVTEIVFTGMAAEDGLEMTVWLDDNALETVGTDRNGWEKYGVSVPNPTSTPIPTTSQATAPNPTVTEANNGSPTTDSVGNTTSANADGLRSTTAIVSMGVSLYVAWLRRCSDKAEE